MITSEGSFFKACFDTEEESHNAKDLSDLVQKDIDELGGPAHPIQKISGLFFTTISHADLVD